MTIPIVPRAMWDDGNLDVEAVNENLRGIARNIRRNLDLRYSTTSYVINLDGLQSSAALAARKFFLMGNLQVVGISFVVYAGAGAVWSLSSTSEPTWGGVSLTTEGDTNEVEVETSEAMPATAGDITIACTSGSGTITRGHIIVTVLCDRGQQGAASFAGYTPTLFSTTTSTAGATLDTELNNAAAAVAQDTGAQSDLRVMHYLARSLAPSQTVTWTVPSGKRTGAGANALQLFLSSNAAATVTLTISSTVLGTKSVICTPGNTSVSTLFNAADGDACNDSSKDITITLSRGADGGANIDLAQCFIVWS